MPFWTKIAGLAVLWPAAGLVALFEWGREEALFKGVIYAWLAVGALLLVLISIHHARRPDRWNRLRRPRGEVRNVSATVK